MNFCSMSPSQSNSSLKLLHRLLQHGSWVISPCVSHRLAASYRHPPAWCESPLRAADGSLQPQDPRHLLTQTQLDQCWDQDQDPIGWISAGTRISIPSAGSALEPGLAKSSPRMEELEEFTQHLLQMLRSAGAEELLGCGLKSLEQIKMW